MLYNAIVTPIEYKLNKNNHYVDGLGIFILKDENSISYDTTPCLIIPFLAMAANLSACQVYDSRKMYACRIKDERMSQRVFFPFNIETLRNDFTTINNDMKE